MGASTRDRFDSWKEIANYLNTSVRTVQRWERHEQLPVHRHSHARQDTVYAFKDEIDRWRSKRDRLHNRLACQSPQKSSPCRRRWSAPHHL